VPCAASLSHHVIPLTGPTNPPITSHIVPSQYFIQRRCGPVHRPTNTHSHPFPSDPTQCHRAPVKLADHDPVETRSHRSHRLLQFIKKSSSTHRYPTMAIFTAPSQNGLPHQDHHRYNNSAVAVLTVIPTLTIPRVRFF